jgi:flagellar protein FliS
MSEQRTLSRYQQSQILNASREQLLLLTYDGLLRFLGRAERGIASRDFEEKHLGFARAQAILLELSRTLDFSVSPELAGNLARTYGWLLEELAQADAADDLVRLQRAKALVGELREAWAAAAAPEGSRP